MNPRKNMIMILNSVQIVTSHPPPPPPAVQNFISFHINLFNCYKVQNERLMDFTFHQFSYQSHITHNHPYYCIVYNTFDLNHKIHHRFKVLFWNVRSLHSKFDVISHELNNISADIINISETWLREEMENHVVNINNYSLIRNDRTIIGENGIIKRGGGICTYIRQGLAFTCLQDLSYLCKDHSTQKL